MSVTSCTTVRTNRATRRPGESLGIHARDARAIAPSRSTALRLGAALTLVAVIATSAPRIARADDDWLGPDKALHFSVSVALASGGYAASALLWEPRWARAAAGATFSLTLGAAKELADLAGLGDPSWRDFAWDVLGTAVGVALALGVELFVEAVSGDDAAPAR